MVEGVGYHGIAVNGHANSQRINPALRECLVDCETKPNLVVNLLSTISQVYLCRSVDVRVREIKLMGDLVKQVECCILYHIDIVGHEDCCSIFVCNWLTISLI